MRFAHEGHGHDQAIFAWHADPLVLVGIVVAAFGYYALVVRRRRVAGHVPVSSVACFAAGLLTCLFAIESPLDAVGENRLISAHMVQHELLATVAPLLLAFGLDYRLTAPVLGPVLRPLIRRRGTRVVLRVVTDPRTALLLWTLAVAGWHVPAAYAAALNSGALHVFQHSSLLVAGVLLWLPVLRPLPALHRLTVRAKVLYLACAGLAGSVVAAALLWAPELLYRPYADAPLLWVPSRLFDQRLAGALMMAVDMTLYLGVAVWVAVRAVAGRDPVVPRRPRVTGNRGVVPRSPSQPSAVANALLPVTQPE